VFKLNIITPKKSPVARLIKEGSNIVRNILNEQMGVAQRLAKENVTGGGKATNRLNVRSGRLRSSITKKVISKGTRHRGIIGSNVVYARIHEEGGVIKPVSAKYLTIPLQAAKTRAGVVRGRARDFQDTFFRHSKSKNLILFQKKGDEIIPLFLLVKRVEIPARPYLKPALEKVIPVVTQKIAERFAQETES